MKKRLTWKFDLKYILELMKNYVYSTYTLTCFREDLMHGDYCIIAAPSGKIF